jgi:N-acetylneuraminic acid mutarotase
MGGNMYVVGGYGSTFRNPLDTVSVYSPTNNTWKSGTPYPVKAWGIACAAIRTSLFCFGGNRAGLQAYRLDTSRANWTRLKDMPSEYADSQGHVAIADSQTDEIYIMGSSNNIQAHRMTWAYEASNDSYVRRSDMPFGNAWFTSALYQGMIYTIGGTHGNDVLAYDTAHDTWNRLQSCLPGPPRYGMLRNPGVFSGLIPVVDGTYNGTVFYGLTYFYDISGNRFVRGPDTLLPRDGIAGGIIGDALYVAGGRNLQHAPRGLTPTEKLSLSSLFPTIQS